ncbi:hypothetical protein E2C01_082724 [Portunus trituberculatus]|uniref:Uncharacterized protein n=1 Tax=Portunus trituberculatus TaxID=210409 RepID=A0A5B7IZ79_PORTR|nr:hypothetical protein [Portunus trituberculatus]
MHSLRAQSLMGKLAPRDSSNFWKELKSVDQCGDSLPLRIEQAVGEEIASMSGGRHFEATLNYLQDGETEAAVRRAL